MPRLPICRNNLAYTRCVLMQKKSGCTITMKSLMRYCSVPERVRSTHSLPPMPKGRVFAGAQRYTVPHLVLTDDVSPAMAEAMVEATRRMEQERTSSAEASVPVVMGSTEDGAYRAANVATVGHAAEPETATGVEESQADTEPDEDEEGDALMVAASAS